MFSLSAEAGACGVEFLEVQHFQKTESKLICFQSDFQQESRAPTRANVSTQSKKCLSVFTSCHPSLSNLFLPHLDFCSVVWNYLQHKGLGMELSVIGHHCNLKSVLQDFNACQCCSLLMGKQREPQFTLSTPDVGYSSIEVVGMVLSISNLERCSIYTHDFVTSRRWLLLN